MDESVGAEEPQEQAAKTWYLWKWNYGHGREDWADPLTEPYEPTPDELDLLHSQVPGHRWNGWRGLTGDEDYYAACSCGWRSTETGYVSPMLRQVNDHLDAVRAARGCARDAGRFGHRIGPGNSAMPAGTSRSTSARASCTRRCRTSTDAWPRRWSAQLACCLPARSRPIASWPHSSTPPSG
jgi:hypothetical protein